MQTLEIKEPWEKFSVEQCWKLLCLICTINSANSQRTKCCIQAIYHSKICLFSSFWWTHGKSLLCSKLQAKPKITDSFLSAQTCYFDQEPMNEIIASGFQIYFPLNMLIELSFTIACIPNQAKNFIVFDQAPVPSSPDLSHRSGPLCFKFHWLVMCDAQFLRYEKHLNERTFFGKSAVQRLQQKLYCKRLSVLYFHTQNTFYSREIGNCLLKVAWEHKDLFTRGR